MIWRNITKRFAVYKVILILTLYVPSLFCLPFNTSALIVIISIVFGGTTIDQQLHNL